MLFCKECGGALNLFETNDEEICWLCVRRREKRQKSPSSPPGNSSELEQLSGAEFSVSGDKLVLTAKEGWVLWSGPLTQPVAFETIVARAQQIYRIRQRRHNIKA